MYELALLAGRVVHEFLLYDFTFCCLQIGSAPYLGGGFGHFYNYAPVHIEYAVDRFSMEAKRQLDVLDRHLGGKDGREFGGGPDRIAAGS